MAEDHYEVLEISRKASPEMVRKAYKFQLAEHHPDRGGNPAHAQRINEAFAELSDPLRRRMYDADLVRDDRSPPAPSSEKQSSPHDPEPTDPVSEPDWGEEVHLDDFVEPEPVTQRRPQSERNAFPWEGGGASLQTAPETDELPRPVVRWVAGTVLGITSLLPLTLFVFDASWDSAISIFGCFGIGLLFAWLAGRRRAAGGRLSFEYVIYLAVVTALLAWTLVFMTRASSEIEAWEMAGLGYQVVWSVAYVLFVESSCIHNRRAYWAGLR